jgi:hypothetical protein
VTDNDDEDDDDNDDGGGDDISLIQGCTNFSEIYKPLENPRHQERDIKPSYVLGTQQH